jgi:hypothetical protein
VLNWQLDLPGKATQWTDAYGNLCHCLVLELQPGRRRTPSASRRATP